MECKYTVGMSEFVSKVVTVDDLSGPVGRLEAVLTTGSEAAKFAVVVAHPHPLFGGTMHNKVVYHAAKAFAGSGLPVLRFNFRGVGRSEGVHDAGRGEQDDVRGALDWMGERYGRPLLFAGFSFGSYVGLRACCGDERVRGMVGLGLPVSAAGRNYTYEFLEQCGSVPKLFVSGDHDEFSPQGVLESVLEKVQEPKRVVWVAGADHFFAGTAQSPASKLEAMSAAIRGWVAEEFVL
jgi:alpha/beta superfamily hydrolase